MYALCVCVCCVCTRSSAQIGAPFALHAAPIIIIIASASLTTPAQTPEFFYHTDFLLNSNGFDFGVRQNGERVGNVQLPPWARTVEEFVALNRAALESEYVSRNLHVRRYYMCAVRVWFW